MGIARRTPGLSGAEISRLVNEACMEAARNDLLVVDKDCFDRAIATVMMGRARTSALVTQHDREITAWHEAGHTICALLQDAADDPVSVSIIPRGAAGGVTWMSGNDDSFLTREKALARMVTSLGGRAAEEILLDGEYSQGAHGDLSAATNLALAMATQYGMTRLGLMVRSDEVLGAGGMEEVNLVVEELLSDAREKALCILNENKKLLELISAELLDKETLNHAEILELKNKIKHYKPLKSKVRNDIKVAQSILVLEREEGNSVIDKILPIINSTTKSLRRYIKKRAKW
jgi:cell division protease FtsH